MRFELALLKCLIPGPLILVLACCGPFESVNPLYTEKDLTLEPAVVGTWTSYKENNSIEDMTLTIEQRGEKAYRLVETMVDDDTGKPAQAIYEARLVELDGVLFLDLTPENIPVDVRPRSLSFKLPRPNPPDAAGASVAPRLVKLDDLVYVSLAPAREKPGAPVPASAAHDAAPEGDAYELRIIPAHWFFKVTLNGDVLKLAYIDEDFLSKLPDDESSELASDDDTKGLVTATTQVVQDFVIRHADDEDAFAKDNVMEFHRQK